MPKLEGVLSYSLVLDYENLSAPSSYYSSLPFFFSLLLGFLIIWGVQYLYERISCHCWVFEPTRHYCINRKRSSLVKPLHQDVSQTAENPEHNTRFVSVAPPTALVFMDPTGEERKKEQLRHVSERGFDLANWWLACFQRHQQSPQHSLQEHKQDWNVTPVKANKQAQQKSSYSVAPFMNVLELVSSSRSSHKLGAIVESWYDGFVSKVSHSYRRRLFLVGDEITARAILEDSSGTAVAPWHPVTWSNATYRGGATISPYLAPEVGPRPSGQASPLTCDRQRRSKDFCKAQFPFNRGQKNRHSDASVLDAHLDKFLTTKIEPCIHPTVASDRTASLVDSLQVLSAQVFLLVAFESSSYCNSPSFIKLFSYESCKQLVASLDACYNEFQLEAFLSADEAIPLLQPRDYTNWIMRSMHDKEDGTSHKPSIKGKKGTSYILSFCGKLLTNHRGTHPLADAKGTKTSSSEAHDSTTGLVDCMEDCVYNDSDAQELEDLIAFMIHGILCTIHTMTWCLIELAKHPDSHQTALRNAFRQQNGDNQSNSKPDQEPHGPWRSGAPSLLKNVLREVLRLHPPNTLGPMRVLMKDVAVTCAVTEPSPRSVNVGDTTVDMGKQKVIQNDDTTATTSQYYSVLPAGSVVLMPLSVLHQNKQIFDLPDTFQPQRWEHATDDMFWSYMPFSAGSVGCCPNAGGGARQQLQPYLVHTAVDIILQRLLKRHEFWVVENKRSTKASMSTTERRNAPFSFSLPFGQPTLTSFKLSVHLGDTETEKIIHRED